MRLSFVIGQIRTKDGGGDMEASSRSALVIEDSADVADILKIWLEKRGWRIVICAMRDEAIDILRQQSFNLILLDYCMRGMSAEEFVPKARNLNPAAKLMLVTANDSCYEIASTLGIGATLHKPFDEDFLISNVNRLFSRPSSKMQLRPADV